MQLQAQQAVLLQGSELWNDNPVPEPGKAVRGSMADVPFPSYATKGRQGEATLHFSSNSYTDSMGTTSAPKKPPFQWRKVDTKFVLLFTNAFVSPRGSRVPYNRLP